MKSLIIEDEFTSRVILTNVLNRYGDCHVAVNAIEALEAFTTAISQKQPYDLICLDIILPDIDGHLILKRIRNSEKSLGIPADKAVKIIMTTSVGQKNSVLQAIKNNCNAYIVKPVEIEVLLKHLKNFGLIENED